MSAFDRAAIVDELGDAVTDNLDHLAAWLTRDQGKPLASAQAELELVAEMFHNAAAEIKHDETPSFNSEDPNKRMFSIRQPHGVYGVITPWNFPGTIPTEYIAPWSGSRERNRLGARAHHVRVLRQADGGLRRDEPP